MTEEEERITVCEAARLQSFPDWFEFQGTETINTHKLAMPLPKLCIPFSKNIKNHLMGTSVENYPIIEFEQLKLFENEAVYQFR